MTVNLKQVDSAEGPMFVCVDCGNAMGLISNPFDNCDVCDERRANSDICEECGSDDRVQIHLDNELYPPAVLECHTCRSIREEMDAEIERRQEGKC